MSEKIRLINKEPIISRLGLSKKKAVFFLIIFGVFVFSLSSYLLFEYKIKSKNSSTASMNMFENKNLNRDLVCVLCRGEECFWINKYGIAFGKSGKTAGNIVFSLEDKTERNLELGKELLKQESLSELIFLINKIQNDIGISLEYIETEDSNLNDFDFKTSEGWILKISLLENAYKTVEVLNGAIEEVKKTAPSGTSGLDYIDLRIPNKVFYKLK